jgi:hypothetical protein
MRIALFSAAALLLAMAFSFQSTYAGELSYPAYFGGYAYYDGDYPPAPLYAPFGYYGCRAGCCRQPVWNGRHWRNMTTCERSFPAAVRH